MSIIVNPISGEGASLHRAELLASRLHHRGYTCRLLCTGGAGDAVRLAQEAAPVSDVVVAVGGDGTVNEVARGLIGTQTPLAVLPTGTANVLAHELHIHKHVSSTVNVICRNHRQTMDLGRIPHNAKHLRKRDHFVCMASCGFDAAVTQAMHDYRIGRINIAHYVPLTFKTFWDYTYPNLSVILDGKPWPESVYHVVISNTRSYGGPFHIATHAHCDDGLLDVVLFEKPGPFWLLGYMAALSLSAHMLLPGAKAVKARRVEVDAQRPTPYQLDGDFVGHTPLVVEVEPAALSVLVARSCIIHERLRLHH